ncbi:MAG TPA: hypothetical protein VF555_16405 [Variovorax sp.]
MATKPAAQSEAQQPDTQSTTTTTVAAKVSQPLRLGTVVDVLVADGVVLINNETGTRFVAGVRTPQTVTATLVRRIDDGDLTLAP